MSEYAVTGDDAGKGSLLAAIAEAGFLIGLEKNWYSHRIPKYTRCLARVILILTSSSLSSSSTVMLLRWQVMRLYS